LNIEILQKQFRIKLENYHKLIL